MTRERGSRISGNILLGITGSVAAYRALDLIRRLKEEGATVSAVLTDASLRFVTRLSVETALGGKAYAGLFEDPMSHIGLAGDAELMLVAPATANTVGKFATGIADDLLSTCFMSFQGRVVIAPAMNWRMYESPAFRENLQRLKDRGVVEVPPERGVLACGEEGVGRLAGVETILEAVRSALADKDLEGRRVVVTAGPTREYLDAVRFLSNRSSGKMGYALARVAGRRGAEVTLISGPSCLPAPPGVKFIRVETAEEMRAAVIREIEGASVLVMAAAVADFTPRGIRGAKLEKSAVKSLQLHLTPDILAEVGAMEKRPLLVGFAAEAGKGVKHAEEKLLRKGAEIIVFNDVNEPGAGFDIETNVVSIMEDGLRTDYPVMTKEEVAGIVLDRVSRRKA